MIPKDKRTLSILPIIGLAALAVFILREPLLMGKSILVTDLREYAAWGKGKGGIDNLAGFKQAFEIYPNKVAYQRAMKNGEIPLWNSQLKNGYPIGADPAFGWFDPFNLIFAIASIETGLKFLALIQLFLIALFSYGYLRELGCMRFPSWAGGALTMMSLFVISRTPDATALQSAMWFPFLLLMFERMCARRTQPYLALISAGTAMSILGGDLPIAFTAICGFAFYAVMRILLAGAWECLESKPKRLMQVALALVIGVLITAPQLLPAIQLMDHSIMSFLYKIAPRQFEFYLLYVWTASILLSIWAIRFRLGDKRFLALIILLVTSLTGEFIIITIEYFFLRRLLQSCFFLLLGTSTSLAAGVGLNDLLGDSTFSRRKFALFLFALAIPLTVGAGFNPSYLAAPLTNLVLVIGIACFIGILIIIMTRLNGKKTLIASLILFCSLVGPAVYSVKDLDFQKAGYDMEPTAGLKWLLDNHKGLNVVDLDFILPENAPMAYSIGNIYGHGSRFLEPPDFYYNVSEKQSSGQFSRRVFRSKGQSLFDLLQVRFVLNDVPLRNAAIEADWNLVFADGFYIYENEGSFPKGWFVPETMPVDNESEAIASVLGGDFNPSEMAVIETNEQGFLKGSPGSVKILDVSPGHAVFDVDAPDGGWLVFGETYYPGWKATIDGEPYPVYKADVAFMAVPLMPGEKRVEFRFTSIWRTVGYYVAAIAMCALIIVFIWQLKEKPAKSPVCS